MDYRVPDFIIEKIREAERLKRERAYRRPQLEIPVPPPIPYMDPPDDEPEVSRGPIIIDLDTYEITNEDEE